MRQPPIDQPEIDARIAGHADELVRLWQAEQGGAAKDRDLRLLASAIPFPRDLALRALDLCCGPGDLGRAILQRYPGAQVDFVDRDPLLLSICRGFNDRAGIPGTYRRLDLDDETWSEGLGSRRYHVIAVANAMHWLDAARAGAVFADVHRLLDDGGAFLFAEPAARSADWPTRYEQHRWHAFWDRANALAGYDHTEVLGSPDDSRIGDGMTVRGWIDLAETTGFDAVDVLWRDADGAIIAAHRAPT